MNYILVTGGLGFIGSHTVVTLHEAGFIPVIVDNCSNSSPAFLNRITKIIGYTPPYYNIDVCNKKALDEIFKKHKLHGVIHFAAFKAVGESVKAPLTYYRNNIDGLLTVLELMQENMVTNLVFSSSCSVYGDAKEQPVKETTPLQKAQSPYGHTKQVGEDILKATCAADGKLNVIALRYFNPTGAHESAIIGEAPIGVPSNLVPFIAQTAAGLRDRLTIHGADYDTPDGTCIRDYIHVMDLSDAHVVAMKRLLQRKNRDNHELFNLGTGKGSSVLECIKTFEEVNRVKVNYAIGPRREGDVVKVWADTTKANEVLGWKAKLDLREMMRSAWQWEIRGKS
jgi:UDP-glucose 4-epimerase